MERRLLIEKEWSIDNGNIKNHSWYSKNKFWFEHLCKCGRLHRWETSLASRMSGSNCPFCVNQRICFCKSLVNLYPEIAGQWHPTKNNDIKPEDVSHGSDRIIWWLCPLGHEWKNKIKNRVKNYNTNKRGNKCSCPICGNKRIADDFSNSLYSNWPEVIKYWHPIKNNISPLEVTSGSGMVVWWLCPKGHVYKSPIFRRVKLKEKSCSICSNKRICKENCIGTINPELCMEWHPTKNTLTPNDLTSGSTKKIWWLCTYGHEWKTSVHHRHNNKSKCPNCKINSKGEILIKNYLDKLNIKYIQQYHIEYLEVKRSSIDFYIPSYNFAIEFDGIQHFEPRERFGGDEAFLIQVKNDIYKDMYCNDNQISLLRIHYLDKKNIEKLIDFMLTIEIPLLFKSKSYK